jgi:hypothetical protein
MSEQLAGGQQVMSDDKLEQIRRGLEARAATAEGRTEIARRLRVSEIRLAKLEAWVEVVMRTLATLGVEGLLIELDEARGADYGDRCALVPVPVSEYPARDQ